MSEPLRLHIGGRERREGWTVFNIEPGPHVDHVGDCRDLSQFVDGSVAEIYASHVFEHLGYFEELPQALAECFRVLSDDGCLRISVPNLEILCRLFLRPELGAEQRFKSGDLMPFVLAPGTWGRTAFPYYADDVWRPDGCE